MTEPNLNIKKRTSLRFQYFVAALVLISLFIFGSILASFYFKFATKNNAALLKLHDTIIIHVDELRNAIWKADKSLYILLSDSIDVDEVKVKFRFSDVLVKLTNISEINGIATTGLLDNLEELISKQKKINAEVVNLLELRKDINWLYPMFRYMNTTLHESNTSFESALNQAITETFESGNKNYYNEVYQLLDQLRNLWRLQILDFRGALIRFVGLNTRDKTQEKNIEVYHLLIEEKLKHLDVIAEKGGLEFETELALEVMHVSSVRWYKDYQELLLLRNSKVWRSDINFIRTTIQPLQNDIFNVLDSFENKMHVWSRDNAKHVDNAVLKINKELWLITSIAIIFVILVYFKLKSSLLLPLEEITKSITLHTGDPKNMSLPEKSNQEINILVNAFNAMRKQVHHRQMVLEFQAMHDSLTGLPNRALLQDRLEQTIHLAERNRSEMSILLLDLDRFKDINDTLGHPVGDVVLRNVSRRLEACLRATDTVARLGGDEFAIITSYSERSQIESFISRIIKDIERVITIDEHNLYVGLSVGVASFPKDGVDADTLIRHADIAMYSAKRENKNHEFYDSTKDYYSADNLTLFADLKAEFKNPSDKIKLYFQPQLDILTCEIIGVESLIRWDHPVQGFLPAEQIVRMAEQTGLISELTYWVISESIKEYSKWIKKDIIFSINLSVWNLQDANLIPFISRTLHEYNMEPDKISFEITESAVMSDPVKAREVLTTLSDMGISLAIDDYGTGFSSLAYLKLLPVKNLKIDKSFVVDMLDDENDAIIVLSTIDLAHNLGLSVIAEGVENKGTLLKLRELGCDSAQGYYLAKPMPANEIEKWVDNYKPQDMA